MIYLRTADNRTVVFAAIKSSCGRWRDVIGAARKSQRRKAKVTLNDVTMVAVTEDAIQLAGPHVAVYAVSTGMIQGRIPGRPDRGQCCDRRFDAARATQTRQIRSSDRSFRPGSVRSGHPRSADPSSPHPPSEVDAARRPIVRRQRRVIYRRSEPISRARASR